LTAQLESAAVRTPARLAALATASMAVSAAATWHPVLAVVAGGGLFAAVMGLMPGTAPPRIVLALTCGLLTGYAFCGRGFAYLGFPPVYVGEIVLVAASLLSLRAWRACRRLHPSGYVLLIFLAWCAVRTGPGVLDYGLDALRDAAQWGYAAFAAIVAATLWRMGAMQPLTRWYSALLTPLLVWYFSIGLLRALRPGFQFPDGPTGVPWVIVKSGDVAVHLAGVAAFLALRLHKRFASNPAEAWRREWQLWTLWVSCFLFYGSQNRGGLLGLTVSLLWLALGLRQGRWGKAAALGLTLIAAFALLNLEIDLGYERKARPEQILENLKSVAGSDNPRMEGTRRWRLEWWRKIVDYTFQGPYFWTGKGFGPNLADEDGFQVTRDRSLRSPHNGHLTILARTGVPGFVLWVGFLLAHGWGLLGAARRSRLAGETERSRLLLWTFTYWLAATINGASDVYLEGPQGGIWFWCLVGVGQSLLAGTRRSSPPAAWRSAPGIEGAGERDRRTAACWETRS